jgi:RNA polymerase sigma factor (sigma-70 family)
VRAYFSRRLRDNHLADDLASETFLRLYVDRARFTAGRPFDRWLWGIARYRLLRAWRGRRQLPTAAEFASEGVTSREPSPEDRVFAEETAEAVHEVVCGLPWRLDVIWEVYFGGENQHGAAAHSRVTHQAIGQRLMKAHDDIRNDERIARHALFGYVVELRKAVG